MNPFIPIPMGAQIAGRTHQGSSPQEHAPVLGAPQPRAHEPALPRVSTLPTSLPPSHVAQPDNADLRRMFPGGVKRVAPVSTAVEAATSAPPAANDPQTKRRGRFTLFAAKAPTVSGPAHAAPGVDLQATHPALDVPQQFAQAQVRAVRRVFENAETLAREPVNSIVLDRQFRTAMQLLALYKGWIELATQQPRSPVAAELDLVAQRGEHHFEQGRLLRALGRFSQALAIEPAHLPSLQGLLKCAEKISAQSLQQRDRIPPELQATQRRLEQRRMLVDALTSDPTAPR